MSEQPKPQLRSTFADDPEMAEIVQLFVTELPGRVQALVTAMREGDVAKVKTRAHQLKGAAAGYGFPTIGQAATRVDGVLRSAGSDPKVLEEINSGLQDLVALCRKAAGTKS